MEASVIEPSVTVTDVLKTLKQDGLDIFWVIDNLVNFFIKTK